MLEVFRRVTGSGQLMTEIAAGHAHLGIKSKVWLLSFSLPNPIAPVSNQLHFPIRVTDLHRPVFSFTFEY